MLEVNANDFSSSDDILHNRRKHSNDEVQYIENFGEKMKSIRLSKGWTLKKAEEQGYPSWRHLSDIENGKKSVTIITLLRLSRLYEMHPADLLRDLVH